MWQIYSLTVQVATKKQRGVSSLVAQRKARAELAVLVEGLSLILMALTAG